MEESLRLQGHSSPLTKEELRQIELARNQFTSDMTSKLDAIQAQIAAVLRNTEELLSRMQDRRSEERAAKLEQLKLSSSKLSRDEDLNVHVELGRGHFSTVYQGLYDGKAVALKSFKQACSETVKAAEDELLLMHHARHPCVIHVYGICVRGSTLYFAEELCLQGSLWDLIVETEQFPDIPFALVLGFLLDVISGLAFIHFKGVVHKDIKPHNILISEDSTAKIADFGLSQQLASQSTAGGGHTGAGTFEYMAPEVLNGRGSSFKSDVFSFGVLMFDLLMRRHESRFTSIEDRVAKALRTCVDRSDFPSSLSRDMELVVKGASEREKPSRYSSQTLKELISSVVAKDGGDARTTQTHRSFDLVFDFLVGLKRHRRQRVGAAGGRAAVHQSRSGKNIDSSSGISDYTSRADQSVDGSTWAAIGTPPPSPPPPSSSVISLESASAEEIGKGDCYKP